MSGINVERQDARLKLLAEKIYTHCGMNYTDNLGMLGSKIEGRLSELNMSCLDYCSYLSENAAEWEKLIIAVTINETYFFREEQQLDEMVRLVKTELAGKGMVNIWSSACSTGEEPYSLVMALDAAGVPLDRIQVYASDINAKVLQIAENGRYHRNSLCFRRTPDAMKRIYFAQEGDWFVMNARIRDRVRFMRLNLLDGTAIAKLPAMDILFCRNVLIYFDDATIKRVMWSFHNRLQEGGLLFLGHAETMRGGNEIGFEAVSCPSTFYYRKVKGGL
ncbi:CheR family methyltransferase [Paenibacillus aurantiacus]|uniref:protein-glutamate O-methyltransferase n=1 Tax=Paenibacillus aurantiacus TaxID=1936118 RepID=A0ABV5KIX9_9BACL